MEQTIVFLDAGYVSALSKYFGEGKPLRVDLQDFAYVLSQDQNKKCIATYYYTAPPYQSTVPTEEERERKARYDKFIAKLKMKKAFMIREGRCQKKQDGSYAQKGVDTLLVMDLMRLPIDDPAVKHIILVSSDTDFVPVLEALRKQGIHVTLYHYTDRIRRSQFSLSNHLLAACDKRVQLTKEHFEKSVLKEKV